MTLVPLASSGTIAKRARSNLRGYEENGEPILEDDEADA
jgi:hypothetical protein